MHISEGVLSAPVLVSGAVLTAVGTTLGLKKLDYEKIPQVAVLSASFFVASLVHVPILISNVHLILNGIIGLILGWVAFPAILIGLVLQAMLFQYGGLTTLGVNTVIMALPAVVCFYLFNKGVKSRIPWVSVICAFMCGAMSVFIGGLLVAAALIFTGESFITAAKVIVIAHIPVMIIEGIITVGCIKFLRKVKPEILEVMDAGKAV